MPQVYWLKPHFRKTLFLFLIILVSQRLCAQEKIEISGQVKDAQSKEILEFCSIAALNKKDSLISGAVTDEKGFFTLFLYPSRYKLVMHYVGYKTDTAQITASPANKFIGVFRLQPNQQSLSEVTVTTSSRENLIDKDVQIVTDELRKGTTDAKGVLGKLNGVEYDRFNNSIKVDNDAKVLILVDGMQKDQEYVKGLAPERLKKVEVIRSPGGRYALEGYSAVINIILKKDYQGMELAVHERAMIDANAYDNNGVWVQNNADATFTYTYNKLNVYAKYSRNFNNFNLQSTAKKEYDNGLVIERNFLAAKAPNLIVKQLYNNYTFGVDYYINPKHTISVESNSVQQPLSYNTTEAEYNVLYGLNGTTIANFSSISKNTSAANTQYGSLFYEGKLDENNTINSSFTYANYKNNYTNLYSETSLPQIYQIGNDNKNATKFYLEYTHAFKNQTSLQTGYGNTWEKLNNTFSYNTTQSIFDFTDFRHKLYSYYSWKKNKFSFRMGAAAETSQRNINGIHKSYLIWQPYGDVQYKHSQHLTVKLRYRTSAGYPDISEISPFTTSIDLQSAQKGNPLLRPEVTHKLSLQTNILGGLITIEPHYDFSNNYIAKTGTLRYDSIFEYSYHNIGHYEHYGLKAQVTIPLSKSFFLKSDCDFTKSSIRYTGNINRISNQIASNQLIYQHPKHETVVVLEYQKNLAKYISAQGYSKGDNDFWILLVQQPFLKKRLSVMLLYFLPVDFGVDYDQGAYIRTNTYTERTTADIGFLKNMFILEINYRFNKGKSVNKTEKKQGNESEQKKKSGIF